LIQCGEEAYKRTSVRRTLTLAYSYKLGPAYMSCLGDASLVARVARWFQ
jgi:hypothetical protein